jgi:adenylyltransferase/sulfurtransferase
MARFPIPTPLRQSAGGQKEVEVAGTTVGEALAALTTEFAALRSHLSNDKGQLRSFVNVYLNDDDILCLDDRDKTAVASSDTLSIVPSIAGGRE